MVRVTRPGGVVAACVWDSATMPVLRAFWDAACDVAPERTAKLDEGRQVGYRDSAELGERWEAAGLRGVRTGGVLVRAGYASFDDLMDPFAGGAGHSGALYDSLDEDRRARLRTHFTRCSATRTGALTLTARAWWASGISD